MNLKRQGLSLALVSMLSLGAAQAASAATILVFGQNGTAQTVTATTNGALTQTTISGSDISVTLTAIENGVIGTQAFLDFTFTSSGAATPSGGNIDQNFGGSFTITQYRGAWRDQLPVRQLYGSGERLRRRQPVDGGRRNAE